MQITTGGGERLHAWMSDDPAIVGEMFSSTGAFLIGRRMFDLGEEPWGEDATFGMPCFVLTHRERPRPGQGRRR